MPAPRSLLLRAAPAALAALAALTALTLSAQPKAQRFTLPNGLRVVHLEDHERPLVRVLLHLAVAPEDTPPGHPGLAPLTLRMMDRADAGDLKPADFERLGEAAGIHLARELGPGGLTWRLVARSRDQDRALGLLADRLLRTVLDPQLLEVQRLACWQEEERRRAAPRVALRDALDPDPGLRPTLAGLGAVDFDDLLRFKARVFQPGRAVLILHGDLGLEQAKRLVLLSLGSWTAAAPPSETTPSAGALPPVPPAALPPPLVRVPARGLNPRAQVLAPAPSGAPEAAALLAWLLPGDPAWSPATVRLEGQNLVATLDATLDATLGATLGATLDAGPGTAPLDVWARLKQRLEALRRRGFTQADLDQARAAWLGHRSVEALDPEAQMAAALDGMLGRGASPEQVQALKLDELNAGLQRWLDPARLRAGVLGDPEPPAR